MKLFHLISHSYLKAHLPLQEPSELTEFENVTGAVRDGITGTMHISTQPILAHKITASVYC